MRRQAIQELVGLQKPFLDYYDRLSAEYVLSGSEDFDYKPGSLKSYRVSSDELATFFGTKRVHLANNFQVLSNHLKARPNSLPPHRPPPNPLKQALIYGLVQSQGTTERRIQFHRYGGNKTGIFLKEIGWSVGKQKLKSFQEPGLVIGERGVEVNLHVPQSDGYLTFELVNQNQKPFRADDVLIGHSDDASFVPGWTSVTDSKLLQRSDLPILKRGKDLIVRRGVYHVSTNVHIPSGYRFIIEPGAQLYFAEGAALLSYSPVSFVGKENQPIVLWPEHYQRGWRGLYVLSTNSRSKEMNHLKYAVIGPTRPGLLNAIEFTGGISFFNSDLSMSHSVIHPGSGDDEINIKKAKVDISQNLFINAVADAIDCDWCSGRVNGNILSNVGGDAIDVSGAFGFEAVGNIVLKAGDKGISVGEHSELTASKNYFLYCHIGMASKDLSEATSQNNVFFNSDHDFEVYQKKPIFGPGYLQSHFDHFFPRYKWEAAIETGSRLSVQNADYKASAEVAGIDITPSEIPLSDYSQLMQILKGFWGSERGSSFEWMKHYYGNAIQK